MTARPTCEGCVWLQVRPRPQCKGETSPWFRMVRDTHNERCKSFSVFGATEIPAIEVKPAKALSRFKVAGEAIGRKRIVHTGGRKKS